MSILRCFAVVFVVCGVAALVCAHRLALEAHHGPIVGIDDANIVFVYARNVGNGHGLVYNVGGEHVEGFTSFLWMLVCAAAFKLARAPEFALIVVNVLVVSVGLTSVVATRWPRSRIWPVAFLALIFATPEYTVWSTVSIMDTGLYSALLVLSAVVLVRDDLSDRAASFRLGVLAGLLIVTRPESLLWVPVLTAMLFIRVSCRSGRTAAVRATAPVVLAAAVVLAALTVFRLEYFGHPLPNTYYAKVAPSLLYNVAEGTRYFISYFRSGVLPFVVVLAAVVGCGHTLVRVVAEKSIRSGALFLPVITLIGLGLPILTGGDHFASFRLYQNIFPVAALNVLYVATEVLPEFVDLRWTARHGRGARRVVVGCAVAVWAALAAHAWKGAMYYSTLVSEYVIAAEGRETGAAMTSLFAKLPNYPKLGVVTAGGVKLTYDGPVLDLMGLNNTLVAHHPGARIGVKNHAAFEKELLYRLDPDIVLPVLVGEQWKWAPGALSSSYLRNVFDDTEFREIYTFVEVGPAGPDGDRRIIGWFSDALIEELRSAGGLTVVVHPD